MSKVDPRNDKIWFLQMLRGIAALIVVYAHMWELFWRDNVTASRISYSSPINDPVNLPHLELTTWLYNYHFNFGAIGVSLFFLVSGFVIPISLEKLGSSKFLFRRVFRLYPVYIIGLLFTYTILSISARYSDIEFGFTFSDYLKNASLFRDFFWVPTIDNVNWTLENEVKFYLLCAFLFWITCLRNIKSLVITVGILAFSGYIATNSMEVLLQLNMIELYRFAYILSNSAVFLTYMFIGTCFYNLFKQYWTIKQFIATTIYFYILFLFNVNNLFGSANKEYIVNYTFILLIFTAIYYYRNKIRYSVILNFFADISYPMYVVHGVAGYAMMSFLYQYQPYPYLILIEVFFIIVCLSYILHRFIEKPFNKLGYFFSKNKIQTHTAETPAQNKAI